MSRTTVSWLNPIIRKGSMDYRLLFMGNLNERAPPSSNTKNKSCGAVSLTSPFGSVLSKDPAEFSLTSDRLQQNTDGSPILFAITILRGKASEGKPLSNSNLVSGLSNHGARCLRPYGLVPFEQACRPPAIAETARLSETCRICV